MTSAGNASVMRISPTIEQGECPPQVIDTTSNLNSGPDYKRGKSLRIAAERGGAPRLARAPSAYGFRIVMLYVS
jgi:hypothetical protein